MASFPFQVTGGLFVTAAAMLWLGWWLLPARPGAFFLPHDFGAIRARYRVWIWLFRVHLFGYLVTVMAAVALGASLGGSDARVLVWPGAAVMASGAIVGSLGAAFYYHVGAWGALDLHPCLVRFSRGFFGLGQVVLAAGLVRDGTFPISVAIAAGLLGLAAIAVTMARPDELERYRPVFHLNAAWMLAFGVVALHAGLGVAG
ncbi:MAG: hypothetical protein H0T68_13555 [Gemmatimonadales bacterium]|nr:hypothetical protein [Gemmatimonadales bacterium]